MLAYASPRAPGYATINVSAPPPRPTTLPAGIGSIMIYGSNALPSRELANPPATKRGDHAPTAATFTTTRKTAQPTLFVPLEPWVALADASLPSLQPLRGPIIPATRPEPPHSLPSTHPPSGSPAGILTRVHVIDKPAVSATSAPNAATARTGSATAPPPADQQKLVTPIRPLQLERELVKYPDKGFVGQLLHNITLGCCIGFEGPHYAHTAKHLPTAHTHADIITSALAKECSAGRMAGPYSQQPVPNLRCSGLGVVPKKDGGWRVIYHLSAPHGSSINDHINPSRFPLHYRTIDAAISIINRLGPGTLMGKLDLRNAFRLIPVRKEDWHLLGIHWQGQWYLDKCLPFGLRSSPALFNQLAEALEWILHNNYAVTHIIHYLDDFFTAGPPSSDVCQNSMDAMTQVCATLNVPIKLEKTEGPATSLTFLGISLDSVAMKASITPERKAELAAAITALQGKHTCTKRQLLSLIGKLAFACKVVPPGRIFLRRLIDLSTTVGPLHHHVTLNNEARADLHWWCIFLPDWPGSSLLLESHWSRAPDMELYTDASNLGYGAFWAGRWFSEPWPHTHLGFPIAWKELYAILVACSTWGEAWQRKRILFHCDNASVVAIWQTGSCKSRPLMTLVRTLFFIAAKGNFHISITHIAGVRNCIADHLSRLSMQGFRQLAPAANLLPTPVTIPVLLMPASQRS